jgi:hypothetical protein
VFKEVTQTPSRYQGRLYPTNHIDEKLHFLNHRSHVPDFILKAPSRASMQSAAFRDRCQIRDEYLDLAVGVLNAVKETFGDGIAYLHEAFGSRIGHEQATDILANYMSDHNLIGRLTCYWTQDLTCR